MENNKHEETKKDTPTYLQFILNDPQTYWMLILIGVLALISFTIIAGFNSFWGGIGFGVFLTIVWFIAFFMRRKNYKKLYG